MEDLGQYLLSVAAAAVICGVLAKLMPKSGTAANVGKMLMGLFLAISILSPWSKLQIGKFDSFYDGFYQDALDAAQNGKIQSQETFAGIIKERCEAYILDKAADLQLELQVEVELNEEDIPKPVAVIITGAAAPYAKGRLQDIITEDLGIPKEKQLWT